MAKKKKKAKKKNVGRGKNVLVTTVKKKSGTNVLVKKTNVEGKQIASYAGLIFLVNSSKVLSPKDIKQEVSGEWGDHKIIGARTKSEFLGPGLRQLSFDIVIDVQFGYKPHSVIKKLNQWTEKGKAGNFILGTHKIGTGKWKLEKVSQAFDLIYSAGELARASVGLTLSEYF